MPRGPPAFSRSRTSRSSTAGSRASRRSTRFRFWRPYTAIRRAGEDDNDRTTPDPEWLPLLWTPPDRPLMFLIPPIPDYPSAAADASAAAAEVLTAALGDRVGFEATSVDAAWRDAAVQELQARGARGGDVARLWRHPFSARVEGRLRPGKRHRAEVVESFVESSDEAQLPSRVS